MLILISPAKNLNFDPVDRDLEVSQPRFLKETRELAKTAKALSKGELKQLMNLSDKLADLNYARFQAFKTPFTEDNAKPAVLAFAGDVYQGLEAATMTPADLSWAQDHLRILSGFYGLLRPLDLMQPYRMEMGRSLKTAKAKDLYGFWGDKLTKRINADLNGGETLINLASNEYFGAVDPKKIKGQIITPQFKEIRDGKARFISFSAKKARGLMARHIIDKRIESPEGLKTFRRDGYRFNKGLSKGATWVFTRPDKPA